MQCRGGRASWRETGGWSVRMTGYGKVSEPFMGASRYRRRTRDGLQASRWRSTSSWLPLSIVLPAFLLSSCSSARELNRYPPSKPGSLSVVLLNVPPRARVPYTNVGFYSISRHKAARFSTVTATDSSDSFYESPHLKNFSNNIVAYRQEFKERTKQVRIACNRKYEKYLWK